MVSKYVLSIVDHVVIVLSLLVSVIIGIKVKSSSKKGNAQDYILAGRDMSMLPVIISISVTIMSATSMMSGPGEVYRYGILTIFAMVSGMVGTVIASYVFLPVYFRCGVSSIYEFLEIRYGKTTKFAISGLFIVQMVFFMSTVLYGPVLALSSVTDLSLTTSIFVVGLVCTFYCSIGGLKAVLWTDVFQAGLMFLCLLAIYIKGIWEAGGVGEIYRTSLKGQRLDIFNFKMDLTTRYTVWNLTLRGLVGAMAYFGTSQVEVQRMLSLSTCKRAKSALNWSILPVTGLLLMCNIMGLILYTIFNSCDPVLDKEHTGVKRYDQMVPYYIVTRLGSIPGLTGLCIAGIFSGSLSSISSALNSISTVTVIDFIKPLCSSKKLTETRVVYIAKALSVFYGLVCIGFTFAISNADSLLAVSHTLLSIMEGPMLAIFLIGVLTRKGSEKCILFGLLLGVGMTSWIGYGSVFSGHRYPSLPLDSSGCLAPENTTNLFENITLDNCSLTTPSSIAPAKPVFILYRISFIWLSPLGCIVTMLLVFLAILATGWRHNAIPADSKCLSPITRFWMKDVSSRKRHQDYIQSIPLEDKRSLTDVLQELNGDIKA